MGRILLYIVASWAGELETVRLGLYFHTHGTHTHTHSTEKKASSSPSPFLNIDFALLLKLLEFALSARKLRCRKVKKLAKLERGSRLDLYSSFPLHRAASSWRDTVPFFKFLKNVVTTAACSTNTIWQNF